MLSTFQMKVGEYGPFPYRIMEYDEPTQSLLPVDLTDKSVIFNLYSREQGEDGTYTETLFASGDCSVLDAADGWVQANFASAMPEGWFRIEFPTEDATSKRVYPRFDDQLVEVS